MMTRQQDISRKFTPQKKKFHLLSRRSKTTTSNTTKPPCFSFLVTFCTPPIIAKVSFFVVCEAEREREKEKAKQFKYYCAVTHIITQRPQNKKKIKF